MNNITKRQHFVPQFYLRQFGDEHGRLHCYKKTDGKQFQAYPNDICFREYGYEVESHFEKQKFLLPNEIEKMFCLLEGEYSVVLESVVNKCIANANGTSLICSSKEKDTLASMVANFISRNFLAVDNFVDDTITQNLLQNNQEIIDIDNLLREMKIGDAKPLIEMAQKKLFLSPSEEWRAKSIKNALLGMNLSFFVTETMNFITSDCPVAYNYSSDELFMARIPLNTKVMLVYSSSDFSKQFRNKAQPIGKQFVKKLNRNYLTWGVPQMLIAKEQKDISLIL